MIDVTNTIQDNISNYNLNSFIPNNLKKKNEKSKLTLKIKSIALHPIKNEIFCGDNFGKLYVFSLENGKLINEISIASYNKICYLQFANNGNFLCIILKNGLSIVLDYLLNLTMAIKLEEPFQEFGKTKNCNKLVVIRDSMVSFNYFSKKIKNLFY